MVYDWNLRVNFTERKRLCTLSNLHVRSPKFGRVIPTPVQKSQTLTYKMRRDARFPLKSTEIPPSLPTRSGPKYSLY